MVWWTVGFSWNTWLLTAKLCSSRNGDNKMPSRTGKVNRSSSSSKKENENMNSMSITRRKRTKFFFISTKREETISIVNLFFLCLFFSLNHFSQFDIETQVKGIDINQWEEANKLKIKYPFNENVLGCPSANVGLMSLLGLAKGGKLAAGVNGGVGLPGMGLCWNPAPTGGCCCCCSCCCCCCCCWNWSCAGCWSCCCWSICCCCCDVFCIIMDWIKTGIDKRIKKMDDLPLSVIKLSPVGRDNTVVVAAAVAAVDWPCFHCRNRIGLR